MSKAKTIVLWVATVLAGLQFLFAGFAKAANTPVVEMIHDKLGAPVWMLIAIGVVEVIGAGLLFWPKTRFYAAKMLAGIVLVASIWHAVKGDWAGLPASLVALVLVSVVAFLDRPEWVRKKFF